MQVHWLIYTLRGWLAFVSFMNVGTAFRCFLDDDFLRNKLFSLIDSPVHPLASRLFGAFSIQQSLLLIHCAFHIHDYSVYRISIASLTMTLIGLGCEAVIFQSTHPAGYILFPLLVIVITVVWLVIAYPYIWNSETKDEDLEDNNVIFRKRMKPGSHISKKTQ
ncbi:Uncharacterised protein g5245 [Pycnogonum litorale]